MAQATSPVAQPIRRSTAQALPPRPEVQAKVRPGAVPTRSTATAPSVGSASVRCRAATSLVTGRSDNAASPSGGDNWGIPQSLRGVKKKTALRQITHALDVEFKPILENRGKDLDESFKKVVDLIRTADALDSRDRDELVHAVDRLCVAWNSLHAALGVRLADLDGSELLKNLADTAEAAGQIQDSFTDVWVRLGQKDVDKRVQDLERNYAELRRLAFYGQIKAIAIEWLGSEFEARFAELQLAVAGYDGERLARSVEDIQPFLHSVERRTEIANEWRSRLPSRDAEDDRKIAAIYAVDCSVRANLCLAYTENEDARAGMALGFCVDFRWVMAKVLLISSLAFRAVDKGAPSQFDRSVLTCLCPHINQYLVDIEGFIMGLSQSSFVRRADNDQAPGRKCLAAATSVRDLLDAMESQIKRIVDACPVDDENSCQINEAAAEAYVKSHVDLKPMKAEDAVRAAETAARAAASERADRARQELLDSLSTDNASGSRVRVGKPLVKKKARPNQPEPVSGRDAAGPARDAANAATSLAEASKRFEDTLSHATARMTSLRKVAAQEQPGSISHSEWMLDDAISCLRTVAKELQRDHPEMAKQLRSQAEEFADQGEALKKTQIIKRFLHTPSKGSLELAKPHLIGVRCVDRNLTLSPRAGRDPHETLTELAFTMAETVTVPGPDGNPIQESEAVLHIHKIPGKRDIAHFKRAHERLESGPVWRSRVFDAGYVSRIEQAAARRTTKF